MRLNWCCIIPGKNCQKPTQNQRKIWPKRQVKFCLLLALLKSFQVFIVHSNKPETKLIYIFLVAGILGNQEKDKNALISTKAKLKVLTRLACMAAN